MANVKVWRSTAGGLTREWANIAPGLDLSLEEYEKGKFRLNDGKVDREFGSYAEARAQFDRILNGGEPNPAPPPKPKKDVTHQFRESEKFTVGRQINYGGRVWTIVKIEKGRLILKTPGAIKHMSADWLWMSQLVDSGKATIVETVKERAKAFLAL